MTGWDEKVREIMGRPGKLGIMATADRAGNPNAAYFGSPRLAGDGTLVMGLGNCRSLANLAENPRAAFFVVEGSPVGFATPGYRLYLKVLKIDRSGPVLQEVRELIAAKAGPQVAETIKAGVVFEVTGVRPLVDPI